jgi:hypothetical protein
MKIPQPLIEDVAASRCLPFIGAGFSKNAVLPPGNTMPDWDGLAGYLASELILPPTANHTLIASEYEKQFGRVQLIESIRNQLYYDLATPGTAHKSFITLPFDTIYTTNFDLLLELASQSINKPYRSLAGELQLPFHPGNAALAIIKMHGDLRHEEHLIITGQDYEKYLDNYPVISTHLAAMLITRTPLFIGYSQSDSDFQQISKIVKSKLGRYVRMSYIVQFNSSDAEIERLLAQQLHVINLLPSKTQDYNECLTELFQGIQAEIDNQAAVELRSTMPGAFEELSPSIIAETSKLPEAPNLFSSSSNLCYTIMSRDIGAQTLYDMVIKPAAMQANLRPVTSIELSATLSFEEQIRSAIRQSRVCVVCISNANPNILFEIGIAEGFKKELIIITDHPRNVPVSLLNRRVLQYTNTPNGLISAKKHLTNLFNDLLGLERINEAKTLIATGYYRAAAAVLGVLLEHSLNLLMARNERNSSTELVGNSRFIPLNRLVQALGNSNLITSDEVKEMLAAIQTRNNAVHQLMEPSKAETEEMLYIIEKFIKSHNLTKSAR